MADQPSLQELIAQLRLRPAEEQQALLQALSPPGGAASTQQSAHDAGEAGGQSARVPQQMVHLPPRLSPFSGEKDKDSSYAQWRAEIQGLEGSYDAATILQAMRRSAKGLAADVMLAEQSDLAAVLDKMDNLFGCVQPVERLYELFYTARQLPSEEVVMWSCRLERIVMDIKGADPNVTPAAMAGMLRTKFWSGLASSAMRDALRHRVDAGADFKTLLVAARQVEAESGRTVSHAQASVAQEETVVSRQLRQILERLERLEKGGRRRDGASAAPFAGRCFQCKRRGHRQSDCPQGEGNDSDLA